MVVDVVLTKQKKQTNTDCKIKLKMGDVNSKREYHVHNCNVKRLRDGRLKMECYCLGLLRRIYHSGSCRYIWISQFGAQETLHKTGVN